jgi:serine/threonine-protein phosphatase 2B catalytic subunit
MERLLAKLEGGELLTEREVADVADKAIDILASEPNVVELSSPQFVVGDVHGQFYDFLKMMR